jgi:hypothetical protein
MSQQQRVAAAASRWYVQAMSDAGRFEFDEVDAQGARPTLSHLVPEIPSELHRRFLAAALGFYLVRPWEVFVSGDVVDLDVPALAITDGGALVIREDDSCRLELFADRADAPVGRAALTVPHGLEVTFHARHELPLALREQLLQVPHAPATGPVPELRAVDGAGEPRPPTARDFSIAIAALESLRLFVADHVDRLMTTDASGEITGRYYVDVGQGSVEIAVRFSSDGSRGAASRAIELVLDGAA